MFYEIEYDSCPIPGVGKFVLKSQQIMRPEKDEIRDIFAQMREISREHRTTPDYAGFYVNRFERYNPEVFYKQGIFMKDFSDDYSGSAPYSQYFPCYQMMGYEQLRTYFTWRAEVRRGNVADTSLSYAFVYIYELLGNIGVKDPQDGLNKLMLFWKDFSAHNKAIDKYVIRWLKDYHIYYDLPVSLKEFAEKSGLTGHYPKTAGADDSFNLFCAISKYDIRKSGFFTDETSKMISDCFSFVMDRVRGEFQAAGIPFDDALFRPTRKLVPWTPFRDAIFYKWLTQPDRRIVLSENEIYICTNNQWTTGTVITSEKGRLFVGYVMKQMEAVLRKLSKYKYKITATTNMIHPETIRKLKKNGLFIERIVPAAVMEFNREATKTVVTVDRASLARIRKESMATQEALTVGEEAAQIDFPQARTALPVNDRNIFEESHGTGEQSGLDVWESLKEVLNANELQALSATVQGDDIKAFADRCGVMPEVLVDSINGKAMDCIGDNLMDENLILYDDYRQKVEEMVV